MIARPSASSRRRTTISLYGFALAVGAVVTAFITYRVFGGVNAGSWDAFTTAVQAVPDYANLILVNILVGVSVTLFIVQLRWDALRVTLTVVAALIFGYLVTFMFNLDMANHLIEGDFKVTLISDAPVIENADTDIEYGRSRGDEFTSSGRNAMHDAAYTFEGSAGDRITILAFADGRRSDVNMAVSLLDPSGAPIVSATSATPEQVTAYADEDVRRESDAIIEDFALPASGIYTITTAPEPLAAGTIISEGIAETNLAYNAFLLGALERTNRWGVWITDALTLTILGLAVAVVFRARQFSLGGEGQLYLGALVSGAVVLAGGNLPAWLLIPLALISAMTAGFVWGLIPGALKAYLGANELVSTLMLNVIAIRFYELVLTFQLKPADEGFIASDNFPVSGQLPVIVAGTQVTIAVFMVIVAVLAVWFLLTRTPLGYEIRMVGANLKFAAYGGINTRRTIMMSMAVSGIIAGFAGAHLGMGIHRQLIQNISLGLVFEGVVVALLARNNPLVIPFTGFLYAYLRAGAQFMERDTNVSFEVVRIIQAVIILLISAEALITFFSQRRQMKKAAEVEEIMPAPAVEGIADTSRRTTNV